MTAPELLKAQMPMVRQVIKNLHGYGYIEGTSDWFKAFNTEVVFYQIFGFRELL